MLIQELQVAKFITLQCLRSLFLKYEHKRVEMGKSVGCALNSENKAYCWGQVKETVHLQIAAYLCNGYRARISKVTGATTYACGLAIDGKLYCWGEGEHGNLGGSSTADTSTPVKIDSSLEVSGNHTWLSFETEEYWDGNYWKNVCALDENHDVYCWGKELTELLVTTPQLVTNQLHQGS